MTRRTDIEASRPLAVTAAVLLGLVSVPFAWLPIAGFVRVAQGEANLALMSVVVIPMVAIGLIVWIHLVIAVQTVMISGPVITIGPEGFRDRRISPEIVPWERFRWSRHRFRSTAIPGQGAVGRRSVDEVGFEVDGPYRARLHYRALAVLYRTFLRGAGWRIVLSGLRARPDQIAGAIRPYARPAR